MRICIPFNPATVGGPSTFTRNLKEGLEKRGIAVTHDIDDDYDLILVISAYQGLLSNLSLQRAQREKGKSRRLLRSMVGHQTLAISISSAINTYDTLFNRKLQEKRKKGIKIVQRLDGVYTFATSNFLYLLHNFPMKYTLHHLTDYVIYQSQHSKFLCDRFLGKTSCPWSTIYNGVNLDHFTPEGEQHHYDSQFTLLCVWHFDRKVAIYPLVKAFEYIKKELQDVQLVLVGRMAPQFHKLIADDPQIKYMGVIPNNELPRYERGADAFIYPLRSALPHVLLESIACGLPVAGYDIGSSREILGDNEAGVLAEPGFEKRVYLYFMMMPDAKNLAEATLKVLSNNRPYRQAARERAVRLFSVDSMVDEYVEVFQRVLEIS